MNDVNVANFVRAESDVAIKKIYDIVGLSAWFHNRVPTPLDDQKVIRMNRDTLYSAVVLDLSELATIIMPEIGGRYQIILTALSEKLDLGIAPAINDLRETVQSVRERVVGIQNAVQAINALPFVSVGERVSDGDRLQRLSEGIVTLTEGVEETRNGVREAKQEIAARVAFSLGKGISKLDGGLVTIETAVTDYGTQVSELRAEISALKASVTFWLDVASVTITLILLWLIFSQVVVFILGLSIYRNKNLFARWIGGSIEEPSEKPTPAPSGSEDIIDS